MPYTSNDSSHYSYNAASAASSSHRAPPPPAGNTGRSSYVELSETHDIYNYSLSMSSHTIITHLINY